MEAAAGKPGLSGYSVSIGSTEEGGGATAPLTRSSSSTQTKTVRTVTSATQKVRGSASKHRKTLDVRRTTSLIRKEPVQDLMAALTQVVEKVSEFETHTNAALKKYFSADSFAADLASIDSKTVSWVNYRDKKRQVTKYMKQMDSMRGLKKGPKSKPSGDGPLDEVDEDAYKSLDESGVTLDDMRCVDMKRALPLFDDRREFMALMMANVYKAYTTRWEGRFASGIAQLAIDVIVENCVCIKVAADAFMGTGLRSCAEMLEVVAESLKKRDVSTKEQGDNCRWEKEKEGYFPVNAVLSAADLLYYTLVLCL